MTNQKPCKLGATRKLYNVGSPFFMDTQNYELKKNNHCLDECYLDLKIQFIYKNAQLKRIFRFLPDIHVCIMKRP